MKIKYKKILFVVNIDSFFISHRLPIALELLKKNYEVHLATTITKHYDFLVGLGIKVHKLNLSRSKINFFTNLKEFFYVNNIIRKVKPDLIHFITIKPILFGSLACKFYKIPSIVLSISGMGYVYTDIKLKQLLIKIILDFILKFSLKNPKAFFIFQNIDDQSYYIKRFKLNFHNTILIPGSGVNTKKIQYKEIDLKNNNIFMACRLLKHKGVLEYIKAAEILKMHKPKINFYLAGNIDLDNPAKINVEYIKKYHDKGIIIFLGWSSNIIKDIQKSNIVVLPSYREGMPKFLLEAAACGRPIITTDVPGCRDAITEKTGFLIEVRNPNALAESIKKLINNVHDQKKMSIQSRKLAIEKFDISKVIEAHMKIYNELIT